MTITFDQAYKLLEDCSAVIWQDYFLTFPSLYDEESDEPDKDIFLELSSDDADGQVFSAQFYRDANQAVKIEGSSIFLKDDTGEELQISLLGPMDIVRIINFNASVAQLV